MQAPAVIRPLIRTLALLLFSFAHVRAAEPAPTALPPETEPVGFANPDHIVLPVNQVLTPAGRQVELPDLRPQAIALSPDGQLLVTAGKTHELVVLDPATGAILQKVPLPSEKAKVQAPADSEP